MREKVKPDIIIKRLGLKEYNDNFESFLILFSENTRGHFIENIITDEYILEKCEDLKKYLDTNDAYLFGAFHANMLVGFIWAHTRVFVKETRLYIYSLILDKNYRGLQIGRMLMSEMEEFAKTIQIETVDVSTATFKADAIEFYKKLGYQPERIYLVKRLK